MTGGDDGNRDQRPGVAEFDAATSPYLYWALSLEDILNCLREFTKWCKTLSLTSYRIEKKEKRRPMQIDRRLVHNTKHTSVGHAAIMAWTVHLFGHDSRVQFWWFYCTLHISFPDAAPKNSDAPVSFHWCMKHGVRSHCISGLANDASSRPYNGKVCQDIFCGDFGKLYMRTRDQYRYLSSIGFRYYLPRRTLHCEAKWIIFSASVQTYRASQVSGRPVFQLKHSAGRCHH